LSPEELACTKACKDVTLEDVFENPEWKEMGVRINYDYDKGFPWKHTIQHLGTADAHLAKAFGIGDQAVFCLGGEGCPPPEYDTRIEPDDVEEYEMWEWELKDVNKSLKKLRF
jgi:hypothetical protein